MVSIYEILHRSGLAIIISIFFRVYVVSSYMNRELSILYEEHKSLLLLVSIVSIFLSCVLSIYPNFVFLFDIIYIRGCEDTNELDN